MFGKKKEKKNVQCNVSKCSLKLRKDHLRLRVLTLPQQSFADAFTNSQASSQGW